MSNLGVSLRNSSLLLAASTLTLTTVVSCTPHDATAPQIVAGNPQVCVNPKPIPANFDYPQSAATVEQWVAQGNEARAREHGWYLWAALNTGGDAPVWRTWCTSTQAFAAATPSPSPTGAVGADLVLGTPASNARRTMLAADAANGPEPIDFKPSPQYPLPKEVRERYAKSNCIIKGKTPDDDALADGPTFESNGDVMIAGVTYDPGAYDWIRQKSLYQTAALQGMLPPKGQTASIPAMPSDSIVLKPMLWPVKKGGFTVLPLWDNATSDDDKYAGFEIQNMWPRAVALTTTPAATIVPNALQFPFGVKLDGKPLGPNTYTQLHVAGTDQFYHYEPDPATLDACDRALLDASAYWAYGRMFEKGDQLVLVAMHIITKEQSAWTFQSVWWHDQPDKGPYAANRPKIPESQAPGPWRHYLMASTYGIPSSTNPKQWPIQYNPYIELAAAHPIETNCINCHHRAAWPGVDGTFSGKTGSYLAKDGPGALDIYDQKNSIFNDLLQTDSMWAISDRVPVPSPGPTSSPSPSPAK